MAYHMFWTAFWWNRNMEYMMDSHLLLGSSFVKFEYQIYLLLDVIFHLIFLAFCQEIWWFLIRFFIHIFGVIWISIEIIITFIVLEIFLKLLVYFEVKRQILVVQEFESSHLILHPYPNLVLAHHLCLKYWWQDHYCPIISVTFKCLIWFHFILDRFPPHLHLDLYQNWWLRYQNLFDFAMWNLD
jgi:hypothetical protein